VALEVGFVKIWLVTIGEPLPTDGSGKDRLYRTGILANMLAKNGHEVVWWSSTFDHVRKRQRFSRNKTIHLDTGVVLTLLHGYGYKRNVSLLRLLDHAMLAWKFSCKAREMVCPDLILCSLPSLELPVAVTRYGKTHDVPVVLDVRDLWPDIFLDVVPSWARGLMKVALSPYWRMTREVCRDAFCITGNVPAFVAWGLSHAKRNPTQYDRFFPFAYVSSPLSDEDMDHAVKFWRNYGLEKGGGEFALCFFGSFSNQFDLETVVDAALLLEAEGRKVRFVLCGTGERLESLRKRAGHSQAILFPGWIDSAKIRALMDITSVGLAPYKHNAGFSDSMPNKSIEYLAGGLPVVTCLRGYLSEFIVLHKCGVTYQAGNPRALSDVIIGLMEKNSVQVTMMSKNANRVFLERFDADKVYGEMMVYFQSVVAAYSSVSYTQV